MSDNHPGLPASSRPLSNLIEAVRRCTPARLLVGRSGPAYRTGIQLRLRQDHAAAIDAVQAELDFERDFQSGLVKAFDLFSFSTSAASKSEFLLRPDLGRRLSDAARSQVSRSCPTGADLQVIIGDGLSAAAVTAQVPTLLPLLAEGAKARGWSFGRPFVVRYCRVGLLNELGDLLKPVVGVLLIGERPGLITAESLSAYLAYKPQGGHTDAERNCISNIHSGGIPPVIAARRILSLADKMRLMQASGVAVKEELPALESKS